jgi:hypothetical protein
MNDHSQPPYRPYSERPDGQVNIRNVSELQVQDLEREPMKYIALALVHLKAELAKLPKMIEDRSRLVDEYQVNAIWNVAESVSLVEVFPQFEINERIQTITVTGPPATSADNLVTNPGAGNPAIFVLPTASQILAITGSYQNASGGNEFPNVQIQDASGNQIAQIPLGQVNAATTVQFYISVGGFAQQGAGTNNVFMPLPNLGILPAGYRVFMAAIGGTDVITNFRVITVSQPLFNLQLGDRVWSLTLPASGILVMSDVNILLGRNDRRVLTSSLPGEWTLELTGFADNRYL